LLRLCNVDLDNASMY